MSSLNGRKIKVARVHAGTPIHVEGLGNLVSPITPDSKGPLGSVEMTVQDNYVVIKFQKTEALIPTTNFASLVLYPETAPTNIDPKKK